MLLHTADSARDVLVAAGFPLVAEVAAGAARRRAAGVVAFGSRSDRSLEAVRDALWARRRGPRRALPRPARPDRPTVDVAGEPDLEPLARELLAELRAGGPRPVTELRRHTLTATVYRAADANQALADLLDAGDVRRDRESGRLAGDEIITLAR